jgi:polar amino acid transport system substrate-binding protein
MTKLMAVGLLFVIAITGATALDNDVAKELAPNGKLRVGVAYAPNSNAVFVTRDAAGDIRGAPRDIGAALAKSIGIPVEFVLAANTGELTELCANGAVDIAFMPADEERRKRLDFSPAYFVIEITYLVAASIDAKTIADVDHSGITVVAISGSATSRAAAGSLKNAKLVTAKSVEEAMEMMKAGTCRLLHWVARRCQNCKCNCPAHTLLTAPSRLLRSLSRYRKVVRLHWLLYRTS